MSSPFSEVVESQGNSSKFHGLTKDPIAGNATTFPETGLGSEGESGPARSDIAPKGGVVVGSSTSRKRKPTDPTGNKEHRCAKCKAGFKELADLRFARNPNDPQRQHTDFA